MLICPSVASRLLDRDTFYLLLKSVSHLILQRRGFVAVAEFSCAEVLLVCAYVRLNNVT